MSDERQHIMRSFARRVGKTAEFKKQYEAELLKQHLIEKGNIKPNILIVNEIKKYKNETTTKKR